MSRSWRVAITRTQPAAQRLAACLQALKLRTVLMPALVIEPSDAWQQVRPLLEPDLVVVLSQHAAQRYLQSPCLRPDVTHVAVGPATASCLQGISPPQAGELAVADVITAVQADSEGVLNMSEVTTLAAQQVVWLVSGEGGRTLLAEALQARQLRVVKLPFYRRQAAPMHELKAQQVDIIEISSQAALDALLANGAGPQATRGQLAIETLLDTPLIVPSRRLQDLALAAGFKTVHRASSAVAEVLAEETALMAQGQTEL
ncbi:MAG: uroporphyrinogen-III synthase [Pseudomonadota bacterium]